jgi:hypothetical protein
MYHLIRVVPGCDLVTDRILENSESEGRGFVRDSALLLWARSPLQFFTASTTELPNLSLIVYFGWVRV